MLVTSRISRHWLIPKGWPIAGKGDAGSALQEAFEEAGVTGSASDEPIGRYSYAKVLKDGNTIPCVVDVYALKVEEELAEWPEQHQRERRWFSPINAALAVNETDLARFLTEVAVGVVTLV